MQLTGNVAINPTQTANGNATGVPFNVGKNGDLYASPIHGTFGAAAIGGGVFHANTAAAGITIPISSATAATFVLYNPIGSGVNAELIGVNIGVNNAALIVSAIMFGLDFNMTVAPTGLTKITPYSGLLGSNAAPQVIAASVATIAATTRFFDLFSVSATSGALPNFDYKFNGELCLPPGSLAHLCGTAAQTQAHAVRASWAEYKA